MRVYFDASVIIAALLSPIGGSSELLKLVGKGILKGITSQTVVEEILEDDKPSKFKKTKGELGQFIAKSGLLVRKELTSAEINPYQDLVDQEDAHLVAGANLTKCSYLVTLDKKHLLKKDIKSGFLPLRIVSPKELLEELAG